MPTFYDILIETESEVCNRIADLCAERDQLDRGYERAFGQCVTIEDALALHDERTERLAAIDREITVRSRALAKLSAQLEALA